MLEILSTGVTLAIILTIVYSNENATTELSSSFQSNKTMIKKSSTLVDNVALYESNLSQNMTTEEQDSNRSITIEEAISSNDIIIKGDVVMVKIRSYFDPETEQVWKMYLREKMNDFKEKLKTTIVMSKDDEAVTESYTPSISEDLNPDTAREDESNSIENNSDVNEELTSNDTDILKPVLTFLNGSDSSVNATHNVSRRQKKLTKQGKLLLKMQEFADKEKMKFERYREPYWKSGEYVFLRTGSPTTRKNRTNVKTEEWQIGQTTPTLNPMQVFRDCDRVCSHYYKVYGKICAHRLKSRGWYNEYKNFENICDMDHANCVSPTFRPHWHPLYKGVCGELKSEFAKHPRNERWIMHNVKKWDPYVYVPPAPTDPTADPLDEELKKALSLAQLDASKPAG